MPLDALVRIKRPLILAIHTLFGFLALIAGAWNLIAMKGTRPHRLVGWVYVGSMASLLLTSFGIFELFGGFGPFHIMSLVAGGALALAIYFPLRRERYEHWMVHHYMWITYSYVGLVMPTGSHLFDYGPAGWSFWARAALYWGVPYVLGSALMFGRRDAILTRLRTRDAAEGAV